MAGINLEELAIKSIAQYAEVNTKLQGMESTLQHIRSDNAQMLRDFNDALRVITDIQRQLLTNTNDHTILHTRVDDVKEELDEVRDSIGEIKDAIAADIEEVKDTVNNIMTTCAANGHYRSQIKHLEELIKQLEFAAKVFGYKLFGAPVWLVLVGMIVVGFIIDVIKHRDVVTVILELVK